MLLMTSPNVDWDLNVADVNGLFNFKSLIL